MKQNYNRIATGAAFYLQENEYLQPMFHGLDVWHKAKNILTKLNTVCDYITNKRNTFTVKPINCSVQEVVPKSYAAPNVLAVNVVRTPQHYSVKLSRQ